MTEEAPSEAPDTDPEAEAAGDGGKPTRAASGGSLNAVSYAMAVLALLAVWLGAYAWGFSALREHHQQRVMYSQLRDELAEATAPLNGHITDGKPVGLISAAGAGMHNVVFVQGTTSGDLQSGPGHQPNTPLPGQAGTSVLMGKHTTYGGPFRHITSLKPGDTITVTVDEGVATYVVTDVRAPGDPEPAPIAANASRLTLITTLTSGWGGAFAPTHAVYVDATLKGQPFVTAASTATVSESDQPMKGDSSGLVPLVLWLQGLVLVGLITVWARSRWGVRQTWLIGGAVLLALLWGASGAFMQLLPNLL